MSRRKIVGGVLVALGLFLVTVLWATPALATVASWNADTGGNWSDTTKWSGGVAPNAVGDTANFTFDITAGRTITINTSSRTVGTLNMGDPNGSNKYTLAASGSLSLIFDNGVSDAQLNQLSTSAGNVISAPISLNSNLQITNASANGLTLSGAITSTGTRNVTLNANAAGAILISGTNTYSGTTTINAGIVQFKSLASSGTSLVTVNNAGSTLAVNYGAASGEFSEADIGTLIGAAKTTFGTGTSLGVDTSNAAGGTATLSGSYTGSIGLTKLGAGTLILGNANSYSGATRINGGTLQISATDRLGDASPTNTMGLAGGGTLDWTPATNYDLGATRTVALGTGGGTIQVDDAGATVTVSGVVSGAGVLTKSGTGTLVLSGANSGFSGGVKLSAGTLTATDFSALGTSAAPMTFANNTTLQLRNNSTGTFTVGTITPAGTSALNFNINVDNNGTGSGNTLTLGGIVDVTNTGTTTLNVTGGNTYGLGLGALKFDANNIVVNVNSTPGHDVSIGGVYSAGGNNTRTLSFSGGANFTTSGVLTSATLAAPTTATGKLHLTVDNAGGTVTLGGTGGDAGVSNLTLTAGTLVFATNAITGFSGAWTISGGTIDNTSGSPLIYNPTLAITGDFTCGGTNPLQIVNNANSVIGLGSGDRTITVNGSGATGVLTLGGKLNDGGTARTLTKDGTGTLTLARAATSLVDGTRVKIRAGTLNADVAGALGTLATVDVADGATFGVTANQTIGAVTNSPTVLNSGMVSIASGKTLTVGSTNNLSSSFSGPITGGTLAKAGDGTLDLYSTLTGTDVTVTAGTLNLNTKMTSGTLTVNGTAGGSVNESIDNALSGTTAITFTNTTGTSGPVTLDHPNDFSGITTIKNGILILKDVNAVANSSTVKLAVGATLKLVSNTPGAGQTFNMKTTSITGNSTMIVSGSAANFTIYDSARMNNGHNLNPTLTIQGDNTGQTLNLGDWYGGDLAPGLGNGGSSITFIPTTASVSIADFTGVVNGNTKFTTLALDGTAGGNSITGVISDGTDAGYVVLTKGNTSTWILQGANTYKGATTVNGGTLRAGVASVANASGAFGKNSPVTMADAAGATLDLAGFNTQIGSLSGGGATGGNVTLGSGTLTIGGINAAPYSFNADPATYAGVISGTGGLAKVGTGTQILTGASIYTGVTTVNDGTLKVSGSLADTAVTVSGVSPANPVLSGSGSIVGTVTVGSGSIKPNDAGTYGKLTIGGLVVNAGAQLDFDLDALTTPGTTYDQIVVGGTGITLNSGSLNITAGSGFTTGIYNLFTSVGAVTGALTNLTVNGPSGYTYTLQAPGSGNGIDLNVAIPLGPPSWKGPEGGNWSTPLNWTGPLPDAIGAEALFSTEPTAGTTVNVDGVLGKTVGKLTFDRAARYKLTGSQLTMDATTGNASILVKTALVGTQEAHEINAPLLLTDNLDITSNTAGLTLSGDISGTGKINAAGNVTLSGHNTYGGGTSVDNGTVTFSNALALPPGSNVTTTGTGVVVFSSGYTGVITSSAAAAAPAMGSPAPVPEPGTVMLLLAGVSCLLVFARRRARV